MVKLCRNETEGSFMTATNQFGNPAHKYPQQQKNQQKTYHEKIEMSPEHFKLQIQHLVMKVTAKWSRGWRCHQQN